jgi:MOSC domain-containing protein YiiM
MSELVSIVYRPKDAADSADGYRRVPLQQARLVAGYGMDGDAKGGGADRHLNVMAAETLQSLAREGFHTAPGQMGEQLIVARLAVDSLPAGTRLQLGASACIEIVEPRTGCAKFERHQGKLRQEASGRLGLMARVVTGGPIRVGDPVRLLAEVAVGERHGF